MPHPNMFQYENGNSNDRILWHISRNRLFSPLVSKVKVEMLGNYKGFGLIVRIQCVYNFFVALVLISCAMLSNYEEVSTHHASNAAQKKRVPAKPLTFRWLLETDGCTPFMPWIHLPHQNKMALKNQRYFSSPYPELITNCNVLFEFD